MSALDALPTLSPSENFLEANGQVHHKALSAFGDLSDNARDGRDGVGATQLRIDVQHQADKKLMITMTDNGPGVRNGPRLVIIQRH